VVLLAVDRAPLLSFHIKATVKFETHNAFPPPKYVVLCTGYSHLSVSTPWAGWFVAFVVEQMSFWKQNSTNSFATRKGNTVVNTSKFSL
jgi:hypothetical protein